MAIEAYKPGFCIGCDKRIFVLDAVRGRMREVPAKDYSEVQFKLDNNSFIRLPFCLECNDKLQDNQHKTLSTRLSKYLGKTHKIKTKIRRMRSIEAIEEYGKALDKIVRERVRKREKMRSMQREG